MRNSFPGLLVGLLFGAGLALSDMINPARVLAFLDLWGNWDPTLAFVMGGALLPSAVGYWFARRMRRPLLAKDFHIPQNRVIEPQLLAGAADPHFACAGAESEDLGELFVVVTLGILQNQHRPIFFVECFQHLHQVHRQTGRRGPLGRLRLGPLLVAGHVLVFLSAAPPPTPAAIANHDGCSSSSVVPTAVQG